MKSLIKPDFLKSATMLKLTAIISISIAFFYLGKHFSDNYHQLVFFSSTNSQQTPSTVSLSPNSNKSFDISSLISQSQNPQNSPPPPPVDPVTRFGVVDENGTMADEFEVGEVDPGAVTEDLGDGNLNSTGVAGENGGGGSVVVEKFEVCPLSMKEYIPCLDNEEAIKRLESTERGERFERHCPENGKGLNCLVPAPDGYRAPIPWPRSRDEVLGGVYCLVDLSLGVILLC